MNHHQATDRAAAERRAEYRSLATDPAYEPRRRWRCPICDELSPMSSTRCDTCGGQGPEYVPETIALGPGRQRGQRGQAIVETALVLPLLLFIGLGFAEVGFLIATKADQDRATAVVATWAADHRGESWNAVANHELPGCEVDVVETMHDLVTATATCHYRPHVTPGWDGLPVSSEESAAADGSSPPEPSSTPSSTP